MVVYDNFNFLDRVRDQALGSSKNVMQNLTTSLLLRCEDYPDEGLTQSMHDPSHPLELMDILQGTKRDAISKQWSRFLIVDSICKVHNEEINTVFDGRKHLLPTFPKIDLLKPRKTVAHNPGASFYNEGTIEGTYGVHRDIWLQKLGLKEDDATGDFATRLWLVCGDQLSGSNSRAVQKAQSRASQAYDRRKWMLTVPGLFHVQMNLLHTIVRTHWKPQGRQFSRATLLHDVNYWNRSGITQENAKFHLVEPLLRQGFAARVLALWYEALHNMGLIQGPHQGGMDRQQTVGQAITNLTPEQVLDAVDHVYNQAFTTEAWDGNDTHDKEFVSMTRYLQEVELFLVLRHAIRHGDIGIIRRLVDLLIVTFFGAEQHKYGHEMLHLRWLLSDSVSTPELQRAILSAMLVNINGKPDGFRGTDWVLEVVNGAMSRDMAAFKNSTHDVNKTFVRVALCSAYMEKVRAAIEVPFGQHQNGKHSYKSTVADIFSLANHLWREGCARPESTSVSQRFESLDITWAGSRVLAERLKVFNARFVVTPNTPISSIDNPDGNPDTNDTEQTSLRDYVVVAEDEPYLDGDPIIVRDHGDDIDDSFEG
jgi:hypothetical protein